MPHKVIPLGSWDFGAEPLAMVKSSRRGLVGDDRRQLLVKRAADHVFAGLIDKIAASPGELLLHMIAVGATEAWSANRNGDGFCEDTCRKQARTFESKPLRLYSGAAKDNGARFYFNHKHDDPKVSYGYVKKAAYNERMRRIELLMVANATKEAAERNGGLVLPDDVRHKLESGEEIPGSMACYLPYDVCANCRNKAASRAQYCTEATCVNPEDGTRGLGCKQGLARLHGNGRQQYVENPNCVFYDFSKVVRPAERTAYGAVADYLSKAAENDHVPGGAELADWYAVQHKQAFGPAERRFALLSKLAALEASGTPSGESLRCAFRRQDSLPIDQFGSVGSHKLAATMSALTGRGVLLSPEDFFFVATRDADKAAKCAAAAFSALPNIYSQIANDPDGIAALPDNGLAAAGQPSAGQQLLAEKLAVSRGIHESCVLSRARLSVLRGQAGEAVRMVKTASASEDAARLARLYVAYQLDFLASQPDEIRNSPLTIQSAILQNNTR